MKSTLTSNIKLLGNAICSKIITFPKTRKGSFSLTFFFLAVVGFQLTVYNTIWTFNDREKEVF